MCLAVVQVTVSCGFDRFGELDTGAAESGSNRNAPLGMLMENYFGDPYIISDELVFEGTVTANDRSGNFYRTFVIEDVFGAAEVNAGFYDLHNDYPVGTLVEVKAKGLAVGKYNGVIQIGRAINSYSSYRVESFAHPALISRHVSAVTVSRGVAGAATKTISSLLEKDCGRLIRIDGIMLREEERGEAWAFPGDGSRDPEEGVRTFFDRDSCAVAVVTSGYAGFAGEPVPEGKVSITGILMYGKFGVSRERFALKIRDTDDVEQDL